jgi:hypothetical protein
VRHPPKKLKVSRIEALNIPIPEIDKLIYVKGLICEKQLFI